MASIQTITLKISPGFNPAFRNVEVRYAISASSHDLATEQNYHEVCQLIGDDTPGDGTDDLLRTIFDRTTVFTAASLHQTRDLQLFVPASVLDEDSGIFFQDDDEIRARVTLTPIATTRESNEVVLGVSIVTNPNVVAAAG